MRKTGVGIRSSVVGRQPSRLDHAPRHCTQDPFQRGPSRLVASSEGTGATVLKRDGNMKSFKNKTKWKSSCKMALRVRVLAPQVLQPESDPNPMMED